MQQASIGSRGGDTRRSGRECRWSASGAVRTGILACRPIQTEASGMAYRLRGRITMQCALHRYGGAGKK